MNYAKPKYLRVEHYRQMPVEKERNLDRFFNAIACLHDMHRMSPRGVLGAYLALNLISADDPWVDAALHCVHDRDIPQMALSFFISDVMEGHYAAPASHDAGTSPMRPDTAGLGGQA